MPDLDAQPLLEALLAADGRTLLEHQLCQVDVGRSGQVRGYEVSWSRGADQGRDLVYVEPATGDPGVGVQVADPRTAARHRAWRYPDDPALPALPPAVHLDAVAVLLPRLGVGAAPTGLELMSYRPGRRAVVRVHLQAGTAVYLKVVRAERVELVHEKHRVLHEAGLPVPRPLGWSPSGLLALAALPGVPAADVLPKVAYDEQFPTSVAALARQLAPATGARWPARRTPTAAVAWYAEQVAGVAPGLAERARAIAAAVAAAVPDHATGAGGIHGDLHLGQLLVDPDDPGTIVGLLDVDTAGPGHPDEDAVALLAQLEVVGLADHGDDALTAAAVVAGATWPRLLVREQGRFEVRMAAHLLAYALDPAARGDLAHADALLGRADRHLT